MSAEIIPLDGRRNAPEPPPGDVIVLGGRTYGKTYEWAMTHADVILSMPLELRRQAVANLIREVQRHG